MWRDKNRANDLIRATFYSRLSEKRRQRVERGTEEERSKSCLEHVRAKSVERRLPRFPFPRRGVSSRASKADCDAMYRGVCSVYNIPPRETSPPAPRVPPRPRRKARVFTANIREEASPCNSLGTSNAGVLSLPFDLFAYPVCSSRFRTIARAETEKANGIPGGRDGRVGLFRGGVG